MKNKKIMKMLLVVIAVFVVSLVAFLLIYFGGNTKKYTWEEYLSLTKEQQMEFQNSFINYKAFEKWMEEAQIVKVDVPWENGGKDPSEYTLEEFEDLTPDQQMAFQNSFKNFKAFEKWMEKAQLVEFDLPWEKGGKKPSEYTREEYEALTIEQQMAFQDSFKNFKAFEKWMEEAQIVKVDVPWENGGKAPSEYTWEEFEALTADQQMAFQNSFKNPNDFEKWMESVTVGEEETNVSFNKDDLFSVTWEEFEAMTGEEQMIFQNSFGGFEEFDKWLQANEPK